MSNPSFVIQKHDATHLHYDFRLEHNGVLVSWAIPKGPSVSPIVKRLAIRVDDHALNWANFEGVIRDGYGKGTVMIWDKGTYEIAEPLEKQIKLGKIKILLHGKKLKGEFNFIRIDEGKWLFSKSNDSYSSLKVEVLEQDKSVFSKKTLAEIKNTPTMWI